MKYCDIFSLQWWIIYTPLKNAFVFIPERELLFYITHTFKTTTISSSHACKLFYQFISDMCAIKTAKMN